MFKKLFKNKPIGFYFSLAASVLSLFLTIFYAAYTGKHDLFNAGVFVLYLFAFLMPLVYFFVKENNLTRIIPVMQTTFLVLAFGILVITIGAFIVYYLTGSLSLASTTASGGVLMFVFVITLIAILIAFIASFMKQTKPLTAEQQAEVDEDWSNFKANTKAFAVKHKKPLIISGAGVVALIVILILLFAVIIPYAMIVRVDGVSFDQSDIVMYETETRKVTAVIDPIDAENKNITYKSSNEDVATISSAGLIKAVGVGETTITVLTEEGGYTAECTVEVKELTVAKTDIVEMPDTVHYVKGEEFDPSGISIVATLTNGKTEKINTRQHKLSYNVETVSAKTVPVTATYEYRGKSFETMFDVYGDVGVVSNVYDFATVYANEEYGYLRCKTDMVFTDTLTFDRDIIVEGIISANTITLSNDADVTVIGRINDFTDSAATVVDGETLSIEGNGSLDIETVYGDEQDDNVDGPMEEDIAGVYSTNGLKISGVELTATGIHVENGNLSINESAKVTVNGPGYVRSQTYNGIDVYNGTVTVDGASLYVYNDGTAYVNRAAVQCSELLIDNGSEFIVDKSANTYYHYGFALWYGGNCKFTISGASTVKVSALNFGRTDNQCLSGVSEFNVLEGSTFEMNAVRYFSNTVSGKFEKDTNITVNGVKFDMSQTIDKINFGEMKMTNVTLKTGSEKTYTEGDTYTGEDITLNVTFGTSENSNQLNVELESGFEITPTELTGGWNTVTVKVLDEVKEYKVFAEFKEENKMTVDSIEAFETALSGDKKCIVLSGELTFDSLTIDRTVWIEGNIKVGTLTVSEGATLYTTGRIWSDNDMTISGGGTIDATMYNTISGALSRPEYAAIRANGSLTVNGSTVNVNHIATGGSLTITNGAQVTVYGKNYEGNDGKGINGIHSSGQTVTVDGENTVLNVLFNDSSCDYAPAAIEAATVNVDGATVNVGTLTGASWGFAIWFEGNNRQLAVTDGAQVTIDVDPGSNKVFGGRSTMGISATEGNSVTGEKTNITIITPSYKFQQNLVTEGSDLVHWMTPEEADAQA